MKNQLILILIFLATLFSCQKSQSIQEIYTVPRAENIVIDGNIEEWNDLGLRIPLVSNVWGEEFSESLSAEVALAWDDKFLYMMADVKDDSIHQDHMSPIWRNDGLEFFISAKKGTNEMLQYLIAPVLSGVFKERRLDILDYRNSRQRFEDFDFRIESRITENGYIVELGIPFSVLSLKPVEGDTIAVNFYIGDSDGTDKQKKFSWHFYDNTHLNKDALHPIVLSQSKKIRQNIVSRAWLVDTSYYHVKLTTAGQFSEEISLRNAGKVLATGSFEPENKLQTLYFKFHKSEITDIQQPLVLFGYEIAFSTLDWLDMPKRYINIPQPNPFENEIILFEKEDYRNLPPSGATLFIGSSSIRLWRSLPTDFPELTIINRGFGGSQTADVLHFFDRIVAPYHPETIVFFAGTNDLAAGRSPREVVKNTEEFIRRVNEIDPTTRILILSNTIAVVRKHLRELYIETNLQLVEMLKKYENAEYVDVTTPGLQKNGQPRPEIYTADSLHLNTIGYEMWKEVLGPFLMSE